MALIREHWESRSCPILNGIVFPDDTAFLLNVVPPTGADDRYVIVAAARRPLASVGPVAWTQVAELARATDPVRDTTAIVGEAGMGADGFVAAMQGTSGQLKWLAFFDCSNPFHVVSVRQDAVVARTNLDVEWTFPLEHPECVIARPVMPRLTDDR